MLPNPVTLPFSLVPSTSTTRAPNCRMQSIKPQLIWHHSESFVEQEKHTQTWKLFTMSTATVRLYMQWWYILKLMKFKQRWKNTMSACDWAAAVWLQQRAPHLYSWVDTLLSLSSEAAAQCRESLRHIFYSLCALSDSGFCSASSLWNVGSQMRQLEAQPIS